MMSGKGETLTVEVAVVGGGPAGMTAAAESAEAGARTALLEAGDRPGRKLLLTGRGRCNLTNTLATAEFIEGYGPQGKFLRNAFSRFFSKDLTDLLDGLGVKTARERGGRIYPAEGGAEAVQKALAGRLGSAGVLLLPDCRVRRITGGKGEPFTISGEGITVMARQVVVATGGSSFPGTGSRGDGYVLARSLGHTVEALRPALVPVRCSDPFLAGLAGLKLKNVNLSFTPPGKKRRQASFGEVHFTDFGISGPAVFPLSREIGTATSRGPLPLQIDLKPALDGETVDRRLLRELSAPGRATLGDVMASLLPRLLVSPFLSVAGLPPGTAAAETGRRERRRLASLLKAFPLTAVGTLPLERAMVTAGGVRLREIDPATMESRLVPGLFFCGEILDLDGSTGGFNLQAAFSTGTLAGRGAAAGGRGE